MKKYCPPIAAIVLALALVSITGFTHSPRQVKYYWFDPGYTIQSKSTVDVTTSVQAEKLHTGCNGTSGTSCKDGYAYTQVVDDGNGNYMASGSKTVIYESY